MSDFSAPSAKPLRTLPPIGLGCAQPRLCLYTPHRPPLDGCRYLDDYRAAEPGECAFIIQETGNHWRKIFSIFAKLAQALFYPDLSWQQVRDQYLFTQGSQVALLWQNQLASAEQFSSTQPLAHIIGGQAFAESFKRHWRNPQVIAQHSKLMGSSEEEGAVFLTPYLDYRQFTNAMIADLLPELRRSTKA